MRLIDADRLLLEKMQGKYYHLPNGDIAIPIIDIKNAPTVKQPEIIHCKDCKYSTHEPCDGFDNDYICNRTPFSRSEGGRMPEEFCSRGEKKE